LFRQHHSSTTVRSAALGENPTLQWKGASLSTSEFANHVIVEADEAPMPVLEAVERVLSGRRQRQPLEPITELTSEELIGMGSVWFLPESAPRDPSRGEKPERLSAANATSLLLQEGDYLRIHHYPRRFPACANYDWSRYVDDKSSDTNGCNKAGVLVAQDDEKGWIVIDKPAFVPVHMTVDNSQENVAACLQRARTATVDSTNTTIDPPLPPYVTTPQRLDQNTSGLLVVASSKVFAAYFAKLLSTKTAQQLDGSNITSVDSIHKLYRCLVCLQPPTSLSTSDDDANIVGGTENVASWSANQAMAQLRSFVAEEKILRHYLEPSIRAPKRFVEKVPDDAEGNWPECLLKIRSAGNVYALIGNQAGRDLGHALWTSEERVPINCQAVVEVEIELLTGRTHQIRGQLSAMGFSLAGDAQYGGAVPANKTSIGSEQLALQCCELEFLDPDIITKHDGTVSMNRSKRWNRLRLERAWWTPLLEQYQERANGLAVEDATTTASDVGLAESKPTISSTDKKPLHPDLLPSRVSLSPGKNKYVLIKAEHPESDEVLWFCKSASPTECGGPYHGNVAQDLREWIEAAGWQVTVTGGGRIDYRPTDKEAVVYGFSYGFGKGDHARAAVLIQEWSQGSIQVTHDNSDGLY
jgi:23S rRNA-/tRNA-specific pseudouridylate synthase